MGLIFPSDLDAWERWASTRQTPLRRLRSAVRVPARRAVPSEAPFFLASASDSPRVLAALDVPRGTSLDAIVAPVVQPGVNGAVLTRGPVPDGVVPSSWTVRSLESVGQLPSSLRWILSAGSYRAVSLPVHAWAQRHGVTFGVVQHGALTPYAPPLPSQTHLFAWSAADLDFWRSERPDVTGVSVGSELLWQAAQRPAEQLSDEKPIFLGQLHGAELPRRLVAINSYRFCRDYDASYRPHPAEKDAASRALHAVWQRRGIEIDRADRALSETARPVVSIFSSGILEAAAQGRPAWRYCSGAPSWLHEFWDRYGMRAWGGAEATRVALPAHQPAATIGAAIIA